MLKPTGRSCRAQGTALTQGDCVVQLLNWVSAGVMSVLQRQQGWDQASSSRRFSWALRP